MHAQITIDVEITDPQALHAHARIDYLGQQADVAAADLEALDFLGSSENPKLDACLRQIFDRSVKSDAGVIVNDSFAAVSTPTAPRLRSIPMVAASTAYLTPAELARINEAFGLEPEGITHRALEDIKHDGLYMSPKDCGFYVRIPCEETFTEVLPQLSEQMRALVTAAHAIGAHRIEFDCDEATVEGFEIQEHD